MKNGFTLLARICSRNYKFAAIAGETARSAENELNPSALTTLPRLEIPLRPRLSSLRCRCRDFSSRLPACLTSGISQGKSGNKAFTLAEVLITLVIIGVIGALTVPALIQNTQKQEYAAALKKAYSTFSQAAQQIIAEEGSPKSSSAGAQDGWAYNSESVYKHFKSHLNVTKDCGSSSGCFDDMLLNGKYKDPQGAYSPNFWNHYATNPKYTIVLADGTLVFFTKTAPLCDSNSWHGNELVPDVCGSVYIDINGKKGPNQAGRDVFFFYLKETGISLPCHTDINECTNGDGAYCACRVITENAMNY